MNRRTDWFWKLAHELTDKFDYLFFETLCLKGMQRLWGRKISDLALSEFLILDYLLGLVETWVTHRPARS
jgi:putative transposase